MVAARRARPGARSTPKASSPDGREADRRLRPLRLLPAELPDLRALARGDGLAARPDLADEGDRRGHGRAQPHGRRALRPLPRLHGVPHLVPLRRAVRPADRARPRAGRAGGSATAAASGCCARLVFAVFPHPRRLRFALRFAALPAPGPFAPLQALAPPWREAVAPPAETPAVGERDRARRASHRLRPVGALR